MEHLQKERGALFWSFHPQGATDPVEFFSGLEFKSFCTDQIMTSSRILIFSYFFSLMEQYFRSGSPPWHHPSGQYLPFRKSSLVIKQALILHNLLLSMTIFFITISMNIINVNIIKLCFSQTADYQHRCSTNREISLLLRIISIFCFYKC